MRQVHSTRRLLLPLALLLSVSILGAPLARALPETYTLRFSDTPSTITFVPTSERAVPQAPAQSWFEQQDCHRCGLQACLASSSVSSSLAQQSNVIYGSMRIKRFTF